MNLFICHGVDYFKGIWGEYLQVFHDSQTLYLERGLFIAGYHLK